MHCNACGRHRKKCKGSSEALPAKERRKAKGKARAVGECLGLYTLRRRNS